MVKALIKVILMVVAVGVLASCSNRAATTKPVLDRSFSPNSGRHSTVHPRCSARIAAVSTAFVSVLDTTRPIEATHG